MMRGLYLLCEGQSEEKFVNEIIRPYFNSFNIYDVRAILMTTSKGHKGGDINYDRLKFNINQLLNREQYIIITTFIDYFRLSTDFPKYNEASSISNKLDRAEFIETALAQTINNSRFIPYIQLHEFEGLLFASNEGFEFIPDIKQNNLEKLLKAVNEKDNPEELNDGPLTAPSKRLEQLIPGFYKSKPFYGGLIAEINTINPILNRCLRFKNWTNILIEKMRS